MRAVPKYFNVKISLEQKKLGCEEAFFKLAYNTLLGSLVLLVLPGNREGDTLQGKREGGRVDMWPKTSVCTDQVVQNIHERVSADRQSSCLESTLNVGQL